MSIPVVTPAEVQTEPSRTKIASRSTSMRGYERASRSQEAQCVAARLPSRMPARAMMKAPSQIDPIRRTVRAARANQPTTNVLEATSSSARSAPPAAGEHFGRPEQIEPLRAVEAHQHHPPGHLA